MSRNYGYAVGIVLAWTALCAASPDRPLRRPAEQGQEQGIATNLLRVANALEQANKPKRETANCAVGSDDSQSDLCAQWKAANAAAQAAQSADQTVTIGWIGVALAGITMGAAIAAAVFAWLASKHAKESVAGFRSVEEPCLTLYISEIDSVDSLKRITLSLSNIGRSDAIMSSLVWGFAPGDTPIEFLTGPNRVERIKGSGDIELGDVMSKLAFQQPETLVALIKYDTVFERGKVERRRWRIEGGHAVEREIDMSVG